MQICMYACMHVCNYASVQGFKCASMQLRNYASMHKQTNEYRTCSIIRHPPLSDIRLYQTSSWQTSNWKKPLAGPVFSHKKLNRNKSFVEIIGLINSRQQFEIEAELFKTFVQEPSIYHSNAST